VALGALFGGLFGGYLIDKIGRKATILVTTLFYTPGWLLITGKHLLRVFDLRFDSKYCIIIVTL